MADLYFEHEKTGKRYKVLRFDQAEQTVTLIGPHNVEFTDKFTKERFIQMGYHLKQGEFAPPPPPAAAPAPPPPAAAVVVG